MFQLSLVDIGANLASSQFSDIACLLQDAENANVDKIIITGTDRQSNHKAQEIRMQYRDSSCQLYATAGTHPHYADSFTSEDKDLTQRLAQQRQIVAVGETGLDFYRNVSSPDKQREVFISHLEIATSCNMPLFMHERNAFTEQVNILKDFPNCQGVIHCFTGNKEMAYCYLDMGLYLGITGWITDKRRGKDLQDAIAYLPLDRIMIETDAPYLLPHNIQPKPTHRINQPKYLPYVAQAIAQIRHEDLDTIIRATTDNACRLFNLEHMP